MQPLEQPLGEDSVSADPGYVSAAFKETSDYWRRWVRRSTYRGRWREIVNRSALALKLLTSSEHGSIIAALTFGLPEEIGGSPSCECRRSLPAARRLTPRLWNRARSRSVASGQERSG